MGEFWQKISLAGWARAHLKPPGQVTSQIALARLLNGLSPHSYTVIGSVTALRAVFVPLYKVTDWAL
jgi:hypothetical protein